MGFIACNYLIPLQHFNPLCFHILNILNGKMSIHVADICTTLYHSFKLGQVGPLIQHFRFYSFLLIYSVIAHPCNKKTASIDARSALLQFFPFFFRLIYTSINRKNLLDLYYLISIAFQESKYSF